jgi:hypothetical protein
VKYALKITRDTRGGRETVHPVTIAPDHAEGYRLKYKRYQAESLQVFDTQEEAERAAAAEEIAASFKARSSAELFASFKESVARFKKWGLSLEAVCRIANLSRKSMAVYASLGIAPNPRAVAKLHIIANMFARDIEIASSLLPDDGGCGNTRKSRGGRQDIRLDVAR